MPIFLLEHRITMKLDLREAWAIRNALGNMSKAQWNQAGVSPEDQAVIQELFIVLDKSLHEPTGQWR